MCLKPWYCLPSNTQAKAPGEATTYPCMRASVPGAHECLSGYLRQMFSRSLFQVLHLQSEAGLSGVATTHRRFRLQDMAHEHWLEPARGWGAGAMQSPSPFPLCSTPLPHQTPVGPVRSRLPGTGADAATPFFHHHLWKSQPCRRAPGQLGPVPSPGESFALLLLQGVRAWFPGSCRAAAQAQQAGAQLLPVADGPKPWQAAKHAKLEVSLFEK
mmetsp:Transcript_5496/g.15301  ORF Transcript_5496/g.15301 Transcript_5496/m.15301 type:complete len:214 (+) Transcript_5496:594-1235(+)